MQLGRLVGLRALAAFMLVIGAVVLNFFLIHLAPGDPALVLAGEAGGTSDEILGQIRSEFGLDRPLPVQLFVYFDRLDHGDFGFSYYYNQPVVQLIVGRIPQTLLLISTAVLLAGLIGVTLGVLAASRPASLVSHEVTILSLFGYAMPAFWIAIMLLLIFTVQIPWFPSFGMTTAGLAEGWAMRVADVARHIVLPATTLVIINVALYGRLTRASMVEILTTDFIRTARSKGLGSRKILVKHALRNAILPVVTVGGLQFGQVIAGAVVVETVFSWPGMGSLAYESVLRRDYPMLLGILFFSSVMVVIVNLLTDICYGLLDPRIVYR